MNWQNWRMSIFGVRTNATSNNMGHGAPCGSRLKSLIQLFDAYDVVIFDTPAFLAVPDTLDLARVVDGVIIVAQWGHTLRSDIQTVCGYLESINSKMIGMVVNQLPRSTAGSNYSNIALSYRQPEKTIPNSL